MASILKRNYLRLTTTKPAPCLSPEIPLDKGTSIGRLGVATNIRRSLRNAAKASGNREKVEVRINWNSKSGISAQVLTARLAMRPVKDTLQDLGHCKLVFGDPEVMLYYGDGRPKDDKSCRKRVSKWSALWTDGCAFSGFLIADRRTKTPIGFIRLSEMREAGAYELSYALAKGSWGQGFASEAAAAIVCDYLPALLSKNFFSKQPVRVRLLSTVHPQNAASMAILRKCGMSRLGSKCNKHGGKRYVYGCVVGQKKE